MVVDLDSLVWSEFEDLTSINIKLRELKKIDSTYFALSRNSENSIDLVSIPEKKLLGQKIREGHVITKNDYSLFIALGTLILVGGVMVFRFSNAKTDYYSKLITFRKRQSHLLSKNETKLLDNLISAYPNGVSFKTIGAYFNQNLNFETIKVNTRKLIDTLNQNIATHIGIEQAVEIRKSKDDKRAREVYIKTNK